MIDAATVDGRRRLILIRRDNTEHLMMIGGPTDVVIEFEHRACRYTARRASTSSAGCWRNAAARLAVRALAATAHPTQPAARTAQGAGGRGRKIGADAAARHKSERAVRSAARSATAAGAAARTAPPVAADAAFRTAGVGPTPGTDAGPREQRGGALLPRRRLRHCRDGSAARTGASPFENGQSAAAPSSRPAPALDPPIEEMQEAEPELPLLAPTRPRHRHWAAAAQRAETPSQADGGRAGRTSEQLMESSRLLNESRFESAVRFRERENTRARKTLESNGFAITFAASSRPPCQSTGPGNQARVEASSAATTEVSQRDEVEWHVFAPANPKRGRPILVQALLHRVEQLAAAVRMAAKNDANANRKGFAKLSTRIVRGATVQLFLEIPKLNIEMPFREITWEGAPARVAYSVDIPSTTSLGPCPGILHVMVEGFPSVKLFSKSLLVKKNPKGWKVRGSALSLLEKRILLPTGPRCH